MRALLLFLACLCQLASTAAVGAPVYAWTYSAGDETLAQRVAPPPGFVRTPAAEGSWAAWLRGLPMKPANAPVLIFTGAPKWR
jgi:hypothetical protein